MNSVRLYRDQVTNDLNKINSDYKEKFEKRQMNFIEYQIMELLRSHMQHQGLIIERISIMDSIANSIVSKIWAMLFNLLFMLSHTFSFGFKLDEYGGKNSILLLSSLNFSFYEI